MRIWSPKDGVYGDFSAGKKSPRILVRGYWWDVYGIFIAYLWDIYGMFMGYVNNLTWYHDIGICAENKLGIAPKKTLPAEKGRREHCDSGMDFRVPYFQTKIDKNPRCLIRGYLPGSHFFAFIGNTSNWPIRLIHPYLRLSESANNIYPTNIYPVTASHVRYNQ